MDTNVIIAIVVVVVIAALLAIGGWWFGKSRKSAVDKSTEAAKAKADARLATEKSAAQSAPQVPKTLRKPRKPRNPRLRLPHLNRQWQLNQLRSGQP